MIYRGQLFRRQIHTILMTSAGSIVMLVTVGMFFVSISVTLTILGTFVISVIFYVKSTFSTRDILPQLKYKESAFTEQVLKKCSFLRRPFRPNLFVTNTHVQTFLATMFCRSEVTFDREYLQMNDRGVVALDWVATDKYQIKRTSTVVILFPNLLGDAVQISGLCHLAAQRSFRAIVFNRRGHGKSVLTSAKLQSYCDTNDVRQVVQYIRQKFPRSNITAIGVGAGSALLMSYLGEYGSSSCIKACACISPPYDTTEVIRNIPRFYEMLILVGLKLVLRLHSNGLSSVIDMKTAMNAWTLKEYESQVYLKFYGNETIEQYFDRNNPMSNIDDVSVPLLCINSSDDPICSKDNIAYDLFKYYPNMILALLEKGGHCGFLEGFANSSWANKVAVEYIESVLEFTLNFGKH